MTKVVILRNVAKILVACLAVTVMTACGGGSKQQNGNATETKTEVKASAPAALEVSDDAKTMLAKYGLTAVAMAPQNAFYTFLSFGQQREVVGFLQTDYALAHTFQYISKGEHRVVYLAYDSGFTKPGTNDRYPQYRITFNYEQPKFN